MDTSAVIKIEQAVKSYCNELGDFNHDQYDRYLQIVIEGYTELNIQHIFTYQPVYLTVNEANLAKMPSDMIDYYLIGLVEEGKIWELTRNEQIAIPKSEVCGIEVSNSDLLSAIDTPDTAVYNSKGTWNIGKYKIDKKRRLIIFEGSMAGQTIYMEYISSGVSLTGNTFVPVEILPMLKAYLNWVITERDKKISLGEKERSLRLFRRAEIRWAERMNNFTLQEAIDAIRSGYSFGPKL